MKKKILIIFIVIVLFGIMSYAIYKTMPENIGLKNMKYDNSLSEENNYPVFYGKVLKTLGIYEEVAWAEPPPGQIQIIIEPQENEEIRKASNKIVVYLKEYDGNNYEQGTIVKVTYTGSITDVTYSEELKQVDCISISEVKNNTLDMYKKILEDLIKQDEALNAEAKFIAIDFENFYAHHKDEYSKDDQLRMLSPNEKQALLNFCKKYNENVIEANFEKLKEQGLFNEKTKSLDGILISVDKIETIKEDRAVLRMSKYRSSLGAIMPKYELNLIDNNYWKLKLIDTMIS